MSSLRTYAIHAVEDDACSPSPSQAVPRRGFDYASLLKRARAIARANQLSGHERSDACGCADTHDASARQDMLQGDPDRCIDDRLTVNAAASFDKDSSVSLQPAMDQAVESAPCAVEIPSQQLQRFDAPYLDALAREQHTVLLLLDYLANRVVDFCSDAAVLAQGHWTMRLTLDPTILPDCTLSLTLSYFDLTLRFDTGDATSRQLVLHHADILERRLETLLTQHDAPRAVEIVVD